MYVCMYVCMYVLMYTLNAGLLLLLFLFTYLFIYLFILTPPPRTDRYFLSLPHSRLRITVEIPSRHTDVWHTIFPPLPPPPRPFRVVVCHCLSIAGHGRLRLLS